jgi:ribosome-associated translation inhibitor RaiA
MEPNLRTFMERHGETFEISREGKTLQAKGLRNTEKATSRKYVGFYPDTDIRSGDWIKGSVSGDEFHIIDVAKDVIHQRAFQVKAYYETRSQYEARMAVDSARAPHYSVGAIVHSMSGGTLQAIGEAERSTITQIVNDPQILQARLEELITQLLEAVKAELPASSLLAYTDSANHLKEELLSSKPNASLVKRLLQILAFFGDVEGTIGLMVRAWPAVSSLLIVAAGVLQSLPR